MFHMLLVETVSLLEEKQRRNEYVISQARCVCTCKQTKYTTAVTWSQHLIRKPCGSSHTGESQYIFILEFNDTFCWNGNHTRDSCHGMLLFHNHCSAWLLLYVISNLLFTCSPAVIYCPYYSHLTETYPIILSACYICSLFHLRCCYHIKWNSELIIYIFSMPLDSCGKLPGTWDFKVWPNHLRPQIFCEKYCHRHSYLSEVQTVAQKMSTCFANFER